LAYGLLAAFWRAALAPCPRLWFTVPTNIKLPVSERATIQRINRALASQDMVLRTARSERMRLDVGHWYVVNTRVNGIVQYYKTRT
jgi:hypothetical protein